jgi:hypothetical protein
MTATAQPLPIPLAPEAIPVPPLSMAPAYRAALATGLDLLESRDACWED